MKTVEEKIKTRMVSNHITDYEMSTDSKNNRIIVKIPWKPGETEFNPESAIKEIASTAELTFREGDEYESQEMGSDGEPIFKTPKGNTKDTVILTGSEVVSAVAVQVPDQQNSQKYQYAVSLEFDEDGKQKFADATQRLIGKTISIWMDDVRVSSARVQTAIKDGKGQITGDFTAKEATALASKIKAGALPFKLETTNFKTISSNLGEPALNAMFLAGIISFGLICLMMLLFFRLPGFVACIALTGHLAITFALITGFFPIFNSFTLTLPGIAGIILSIGMGVDANIIIASRIREEINFGRPLDKAVDAGSKNSFWAVFDGNITVIIVALILMGIFGPANILSWLFGASITGQIYSFGYTLLVGVICNFLMGMTATRLMTKSLSRYKLFKNKWLYGEKKQKPTPAHLSKGGDAE
jgi:protein-export membrane protein SecD